MIEEAKIIRFADHPILGCPGELFVEGIKYCQTLEPPWIPNKGSSGGTPYKSCVPVGEYQLLQYESEKYGACFIILNTELDVYAFDDDRVHSDQRFKCLFAHRGSYVSNFVGCVGLGRHYKLIGTEMGISSTRDTCEKMMHLFYKEGLKKLTIEWKH